MNTVLVVDGPHEPATDLVVTALNQRGIPVFRMDTAQFPREVELRGHHDGSSGWSGTLRTIHRTVELSDIKAVYWNRPNIFEFPDLSEADVHWARGAARIGLGGVLTSLAAPTSPWLRWMNHPNRAAAAEFKPDQLRVAASCGLHTPRTLVTNSADAVFQFAKNVSGPIVTKPMGAPYIAHGAGLETMHTRLVDLDALDGVDITAHLFQQQVTKDYEVRLMSIGGTCHSVRIDAHSNAARLDWRTDYDALEYTTIATPAPVDAAVRRYMEVMGLTYAAFDFIVQPTGTWTFLEANPSGQWAWLHSNVRPLADFIADTLTEWCAS